MQLDEGASSVTGLSDKVSGIVHIKLYFFWLGLQQARGNG